MAKIGQNGDKYGPRKQVDMAGPLGPIGQRRLVPHGHHLAPPSATWHFATSPIRGSSSRSILKHWFKSVCTDGWDGVDVDPLAHPHTLGGSNRPCNRLTSQVSPRAGFTNHLGGATSTLGCKGGASKGQPMPYCHCPAPSASTNLPTPYKYPHASLHYK
jgi:hypothetical protein